jgi:hypothetical protein
MRPQTHSSAHRLECRLDDRPANQKARRGIGQVEAAGIARDQVTTAMRSAWRVRREGDESPKRAPIFCQPIVLTPLPWPLPGPEPGAPAGSAWPNLFHFNRVYYTVEDC